MAGTYQVTITEPAVKDLEEILDYILENDSYQKAVEMRRTILDAINSLAEMPTKHGLVQEVVGITDIVYRRVIVKKRYRVIYRIEESDQDVFVIRILHIKRGPGFVKKALG